MVQEWKICWFSVMLIAYVNQKFIIVSSLCVRCDWYAKQSFVERMEILPLKCFLTLIITKNLYLITKNCTNQRISLNPFTRNSFFTSFSSLPKRKQVISLFVNVSPFRHWMKQFSHAKMMFFKTLTTQKPTLFVACFSFIYWIACVEKLWPKIDFFRFKFHFRKVFFFCFLRIFGWLLSWEFLFFERNCTTQLD